MGSSASGRTVTLNKETDQLNERLGDLRDQLREAMADENLALSSLRQAEKVVGRANARVRQCSARLALWQKELGDRGVVVDELNDHEIVRIEGISHRLPVIRHTPVIGDAAAVAKFDHGIKADAHAVHDVPHKRSLA